MIYKRAYSQYGGGKQLGAGAVPSGGAPRRHPDFAKGEGQYAGAGGGAPGAGAGAGAAPGAPAPARFGSSWGGAYPRAPQPPAPAAPWRPQPGAPQPQWSHPPYQPPVNILCF